MSKAWETDQRGNDLLVLLALCDFASDEGVCFPSLSTLKDKAKVSKTTLTYILNAYEEIGAITRTQRKRENKSDTSTLYKINTLVIDSNKYKEAYQKARKYTPKSSQCEHHLQDEKNHNVNTQTANCEHLEPSSFNHQDKEKNKKETLPDVKPQDIIHAYREFICNLNSKVKETKSLNALVLIPKDQQREVYYQIIQGLQHYGIVAKAESREDKFLINLLAFIEDKIYLDFQNLPKIVPTKPTTQSTCNLVDEVLGRKEEVEIIDAEVLS